MEDLTPPLDPRRQLVSPGCLKAHQSGASASIGILQRSQVQMASIRFLLEDYPSRGFLFGFLRPFRTIRSNKGTLQLVSFRLQKAATKGSRRFISCVDNLCKQCPFGFLSHHPSSKRGTLLLVFLSTHPKKLDPFCCLHEQCRLGE